MDYEISYSSRRTVSLSVKDQKLYIRAPYGTSKDKLSKIVDEHVLWIEKQLALQSVPRIKDQILSDEKILELKKSARIILKAKTDKFAKIMGLEYGRITITSAKHRFGSCNSSGNIAYSYLLLLYPEEAIDYVVVHELAHLVEMNHSHAFYKIIEGILPDYKNRKKLLKL